MNNKETGWYPVAMTPTDLSDYISVGRGRVYSIQFYSKTMKLVKRITE